MDDARTTVVYAVSELHPWRVRCDFLIFGLYDLDAEPIKRRGNYEYVHVGEGLERPISIADAESVDARLKAGTYAAFQNDLVSYWRLGEALLRRDLGRLREIRASMFADDKSKDLGLLAAHWKALAGPRGTTKRLSEMASYFLVSESTIQRRLDECEARGLLDASDRERRPPRKAA